MKEYSITIHGQPPSKSNDNKVAVRAGRLFFYTDKKVKAYEKSFTEQNPFKGLMLTGRFELEADIFFESDRPDLDNALKVILDCLQACETIKNDRKCARIIARKFIDKERPRVELRLRELLTQE